MTEDLDKKIDSSSEFFDVICSSKDCAPEMKNKLLKKKRAKTVFYPKTKNQVRKILNNNRCVIRSGASSYLGQVIPDEDEVIIDMNKFDSVKILNDKAVVGASTPFIHILRLAARNGMEARVFPLSFRSSTPAGFLCNGKGIGIGSPEHGNFADNIEEIEVVTPNSEILKIKDNDIKDFAQSEGTLGVITKMKIKLQQKAVRYMHMYGFDSRIDMDRFFEESNDVRFAYFFNRTAANILNQKWQLKDVPEYSMVVQDMNSKDDYKREFREDLSTKGVSFIYPKWIVDLESSRINMVELSTKENRNFIHIADAVGNIQDALRVLNLGEKHNIPVFGMLGKNEVLLRFYANCDNMFKREKFFMVMDKVYKHMEPYSRGRFFQNQYKGTNSWKRLMDSKAKYNVTKNLGEREPLNNNILLKKMLSPLTLAWGGKLW